MPQRKYKLKSPRSSRSAVGRLRRYVTWLGVACLLAAVPASAGDYSMDAQDHAAELRAAGMSWDDIHGYLHDFLTGKPPPKAADITLPDVTVGRPDDSGVPEFLLPHEDDRLLTRVEKARRAVNLQKSANDDPVVDAQGNPTVVNRILNRTGHPQDIMPMPPSAAHPPGEIIQKPQSLPYYSNTPKEM